MVQMKQYEAPKQDMATPELTRRGFISDVSRAGLAATGLYVITTQKGCVAPVPPHPHIDLQEATRYHRIGSLGTESTNGDFKNGMIGDRHIRVFNVVGTGRYADIDYNVHRSGPENTTKVSSLWLRLGGKNAYFMFNGVTVDAVRNNDALEAQIGGSYIRVTPSLLEAGETNSVASSRLKTRGARTSGVWELDTENRGIGTVIYEVIFAGSNHGAARELWTNVVTQYAPDTQQPTPQPPTPQPPTPQPELDSLVTWLCANQDLLRAKDDASTTQINEGAFPLFYNITPNGDGSFSHALIPQLPDPTTPETHLVSSGDTMGAYVVAAAGQALGNVQEISSGESLGGVNPDSCKAVFILNPNLDPIPPEVYSLTMEGDATFQAVVRAGERARETNTITVPVLAQEDYVDPMFFQHLALAKHRTAKLINHD